MFCSNCGHKIPDNAQFCESCGAPLRAPGAVTQYDYAVERGGRSRGSGASSNMGGDPYKDQIAQLKLQIRQLKLDLKQISTGMSSTRAQYNQTSAFVPRGLLKHGFKWFEDLRLLGPQQQKQRLQQEIMRLEQELLGLQHAQMQWKNERRG